MWISAGVEPVSEEAKRMCSTLFRELVNRRIAQEVAEIKVTEEGQENVTLPRAVSWDG